MDKSGLFPAGQNRIKENHPYARLPYLIAEESFVTTEALRRAAAILAATPDRQISVAPVLRRRGRPKGDFRPVPMKFIHCSDLHFDCARYGVSQYVVHAASLGYVVPTRRFRGKPMARFDQITQPAFRLSSTGSRPFAACACRCGVSSRRSRSIPTGTTCAASILSWNRRISARRWNSPRKTLTTACSRSKRREAAVARPGLAAVNRRLARTGRLGIQAAVNLRCSSSDLTESPRAPATISVSQPMRMAVYACWHNLSDKPWSAPAITRDVSERAFARAVT